MQRASTPWQYNTPTRSLEVPVAGLAGESDSPKQQPSSGTGGPQMKKLADSAPLPDNYVRRVRTRAQRNLQSDSTSYKRLVADLQMLADSASRAGNIQQAIQAYHKMGVVLDNAGQFREAMSKYKQFLALCITSKNVQGEALAYNCLGIDSFKVGDHDESIQYHNKHLELADNTGRLIAHTNLGIVFQAT